MKNMFKKKEEQKMFRRIIKDVIRDTIEERKREREPGEGEPEEPGEERPIEEKPSGEEKLGKYLTWSEVEGYIQATLYDDKMIPVWVFSGLYEINLEHVNVKIVIGVPETVTNPSGKNLVAIKSEGKLSVIPEEDWVDTWET